MQNQRTKKNDILSIETDDDLNNDIYMLVSLLLKGYSRNKASFLRDILGLYLLANGTARRSIDTLNQPESRRISLNFALTACSGLKRIWV